MKECQAAFNNLKEYLGSPPLLSKSNTGEVLYLYLAVSPFVVSSILIREEENVQKSIYYVSKVLQNTKTRYSRLEKTIYPRPCHYGATVLTLFPSPLSGHLDWPTTKKTILQRPNILGQKVKWMIELSKFYIDYWPWPTMKVQNLIDLRY